MRVPERSPSKRLLRSVMKPPSKPETVSFATDAVVLGTHERSEVGGRSSFLPVVLMITSSTKPKPFCLFRGTTKGNNPSSESLFPGLSQDQHLMPARVTRREAECRKRSLPMLGRNAIQHAKSSHRWFERSSLRIGAIQTDLAHIRYHLSKDYLVAR